MNSCGSFPLRSTPHSLFSIWTNLKRSEKIPGAPKRRWGEWIWLNGPSGLHRNSPQGLNIRSVRVFDLIRDPEIPIILRPHLIYNPEKKNRWNSKIVSILFSIHDISITLLHYFRNFRFSDKILTWCEAWIKSSGKTVTIQFTNKWGYWQSWC